MVQERVGNWESETTMQFRGLFHPLTFAPWLTQDWSYAEPKPPLQGWTFEYSV